MNQGQVDFLPLRYLGKLGVLTDRHGWVGDLCSSASHFWAAGDFRFSFFDSTGTRNSPTAAVHPPELGIGDSGLGTGAHPPEVKGQKLEV